MTFVGKILVIIIMVLSLFFLAISTVVFTTSVNWREAAEAQKTEVSKLQSDLNVARQQVDTITEDLETAKAQHATAIQQREAQIAALQQDNEAAQQEIQEVRTALETAQESARVALLEAQERREETLLLREQLEAVQEQANQFALQRTELNDQIRLLERDLEVATRNNQTLRESVNVLRSALRQSGLSDDVSRYQAIESPPDVDGRVLRVDPRNRWVQISIGSDDGLVEGHELTVMRLDPTPQYIGTIRIISADPDQAVANIVGRTRLGMRIEEGDIVTTQIRPRG